MPASRIISRGMGPLAKTIEATEISAGVAVPISRGIALPCMFVLA